MTEGNFESYMYLERYKDITSSAYSFRQFDQSNKPECRPEDLLSLKLAFNKYLRRTRRLEAAVKLEQSKGIGKRGVGLMSEFGLNEGKFLADQISELFHMISLYEEISEDAFELGFELTT